MPLCNICSSVYVISATVYMWKNEAHLLQQEKKIGQRSVENWGNICFCAGWHAVEGGRNPLATLSFCSACGPESMNRCVQHVQTQKASQGLSFLGVFREKKWAQKNNPHNYKVSQALVFSDLYPMTPEKPSLVISRHFFAARLTHTLPISRFLSNGCAW